MGETKLMNLAEEFRHIADIEGGKFDFNSKKYAMGGGVRQTQDTYFLAITHKEFPILFKYEMGVAASGSIFLRFPFTSDEFSFEITVKNALFLLFKKHAFPFKIKSDSENLKRFLETSKSVNELVQIIRKLPFDPIIIGKKDGNEFTVNTTFHISFEERTEVIRPMLAFYKELIDYIQP